jgi:hypothetical protein
MNFSMVVVELVQYKLKQDVDEQAFLDTLKPVLENFLEKQPGFVKPWEIFKDKDGTWTEVVRWENMDYAQKAQDPTIHGPCQEFFSYMDESTVKKSFIEERKRFD